MTNCRTLDDPKYSGQNELLAVNGRGVVLGYDNESYLARPPYRPKDYRYLGEYPGSQYSMVTGFVGNHVIAGYIVDTSQLKGIWSFFRMNGVWSLLIDRHEGKGADAVTEILGINRLGDAVGFYLNAKGIAVPFLLSVGPEEFTKLAPPGANGAEATGIDDPGAVVGFYTASDGSMRGYLYERKAYTELSYPGSGNTWFSGVASGDQIVGSYIDSSGATHGLLVTHPVGNPQWQSLDFPNAAATEARGINAESQIVGDFVDGSGNTHGFLCK